MAIVSSTLRPGFLVSLKTSTSGNIHYVREITKSLSTDEKGGSSETWTTTKRITDPAECEAAKKAQSKARALVAGICSKSQFGLMCPESRAEELEAKIEEARKVAREFNETAKLTRLRVYVITGKVAPDDAEAIKAINSEIRELLGDMADGVSNKDAEAIRSAATAAKQLGQMLTQESEVTVRMAVETARKTATEIKKAGDQAAVDTSALRRLQEARTAFLDLDDSADVQVARKSGRTLDIAANA